MEHYLLNKLAIEAVVLSAALPPYYVVRLGVRVVELYHEFELERLLWSKLSNFLIGYFGDPEVPLGPLHLHSASPAILVGVPSTEPIGRPQKPQILSERCLVFDTQD